jgi:hypothetical protein
MTKWHSSDETLAVQEVSSLQCSSIVQSCKNTLVLHWGLHFQQLEPAGSVALPIALLLQAMPSDVVCCAGICCPVLC